MGLRINTNIQALNAHKNLTKTDGMLGQSLERLSSGLRINKAADDASGLAIADTLRAQHTGIGQAIANANDGVNIIQIADGALEESLNIVNTIRTKAIQSASDGQSASSRKAIQADVNKLLEELEMIGSTTAYNGVSLLDGGFINKSFHVGAYKDQVVGINIGDARGTKIGAMAYATTKRDSEAAVSNPFIRGQRVDAQALADGDLRMNSVQIDATVAHLTTYGSTDSAWAKAAAINAKVNESGVQAKATTDTMVRVAGAISGILINGHSAGGKTIDNNDKLVSWINNNVSFQKEGIRAAVVGSNVKITADDGRNLVLSVKSANYTNGRFVFEGVSLGDDQQAYKVRGKLTLSNARSMAGGENSIKSGSINAGDLVINGVDIAAAGALTIKDNDSDRTLLNAINNNKELQTLGIRAELYREAGDTANTARIRLISDNDSISITGNDPGKVAKLVSGTTGGVKKTGILVEGAATDTNPTDNYLIKAGFNGAMFGTKELDGASNAGGNDLSVVTRSYLQGDNVNATGISAGDLYVNGVQLKANTLQLATYGSTDSAWSKAAIINASVNDTGVSAKATTEIMMDVDFVATAIAAGRHISGVLINGISLGGKNISDGSKLASYINNNTSFKKMGIRAEEIGSEVRITADDGRNIVLSVKTANYISGLHLNGVSIADADRKVTQRGTLTLTNSRAMVNGESNIVAGSINEGELVINGVDIAKGGSLSILAGDSDRTLVNAINNNTDMQKLGIRAELYKDSGDSDFRLRLISENSDITISGTNPNKVANFVSGTTAGKVTTGINVTGALVDGQPTKDDYLEKLGFSGIQYGTIEQTGVDNTAGNDKMVFGQDRLNYNSGDIQVNGYKIGQASDDGISTAMGDKSAAALAAAINLVKTQTGVEADIIKAVQEGAGTVNAGTLQQRDLMINGVDIIRDNTGGSGMAIKDGDADHALMDAINEYKDETGVIASINDNGALVLSAVDGRNIQVQSTANGNKLVKFEADFGEGKGVAQDSVYMGNIRLVADSSFKVDGAGSNNAAKEISLLKMGLAGGGASTEATSDLKGDGTFTAGVNYKTAIAKVDVTTQEGAEMAIRSADYAIKRLDELRSGLGSTQNQLTSTIANLSVTKINVQATESTIRDVDFAAESTTFSKMQVLMQAGTYAQSQANAMSQNVMRLLQ